MEKLRVKYWDIVDIINNLFVKLVQVINEILTSIEYNSIQLIQNAQIVTPRYQSCHIL